MTNLTAVKQKEAGIPIRCEDRDVHKRLHERVSRRAYEPFEQSGRENGRDLADCYQAESETTEKIEGIRESASWYTFNYPVEEFRSEEVSVDVQPECAIITAEHAHSGAEHESSRISSASHGSLFLIARWPSSVDPSTATAYIKGGMLALTAKRAAAGK